MILIFAVAVCIVVLIALIGLALAVIYGIHGIRSTMDSTKASPLE